MRRKRIVLAFYCALAMGITLMAAPATAQEMGVPVTDRQFLDLVSKKLGLETSRLASGRVTVWKQRGATPSLIVFLDGTEAGRFERSQADALLADFPEIRSQLASGNAGPSASQGEGGSAQGSGSSWLSTQDKEGLWDRLGHWDESLTLGYAMDYSYSGVLVRRGRTEAALVKKFGFIYVGAEASYVSFKGELSDSVPYAAKAGRFGGGARIGADFVRYHLQWAPLPLPEFFWTESDLRGKYFGRNAGTSPTKVVKIFENAAPPSLAHSVETRMGAFRYTVTVAPDIYKAPIHYAAFDDLPGFLGTWGMGMVVTPEGFIPGGWYRFAPVALTSISLGEQGIPLSLGLGRISYFGSDRSQFRVAWSGELIFGLRSKEGR
ncbi:MAG: hypothetical protein JWP91_2071 [Fibrobacteres bacterium]|nr:hypothetical protein [Fibrobacterota bacterium]